MEGVRDRRKEKDGRTETGQGKRWMERELMDKQMEE